MGLNTFSYDELISSYKIFNNDDMQQIYEKDLTDLVEISFNDEANYLDTNNARLPSTSELFNEPKWINHELYRIELIKRCVNSAKLKINEYDSSRWRKHTRFLNSAEKIAQHLRGDIDVGFLTSDWCIFYELISKYELIPVGAISGPTLFSFHMCEAPKAFSSSLNHYLKLNHPDIRNRYMLATIDNWGFGPDMTDDITDFDYPWDLRQCCGKNLPHLITATGSFDNPDKSDAQESSVSWFHLRETLIALNVLRTDGNFVIKVSAFIECNALCLLTLLATAFHQTAIEKPATSEETNSEMYVVCRGYVGRDAIAPYLDRLLQIDLETYRKYSMFPMETNHLFYREITEYAILFANLQMAAIQRIVKIYEINPEHQNLRKHSDFLQEKFAEIYINKYNLGAIESEDIVESIKPSHAESIQTSAILTNDLLMKIAQELNDDTCQNLPNQLQLPRASEIPVSAFKISLGEPIDVVCSSEFCHDRFMNIRNEIIQVYGIQNFNIAAAKLPIDCPNHCAYANFTFLAMRYDCAELERQCLDLIFKKLTRLHEGDNFILTAFPLLTQFNVNLLCVILQCFRMIIFNAPNQLTLIDLDLKKLDLWREKLHQLTQTYTPKQAIISFLPMSYVTGSDNTFYKWLVEVNNSVLFHEINRVIHSSAASSS